MGSTSIRSLLYAAGPANAPQITTSTLGNPTNLTASTGDSPGEVHLSWTPAANASLYVVYLVKPNGTQGIFWPVSTGDTSSETINGLEYGQEYLFIVIAGRQQSPFEWSSWSNWVKAVSAGPTPPPPPTHGSLHSSDDDCDDDDRYDDDEDRDDDDWYDD